MMKEKAIRKYNHVVVLTPMVYAFNLSGCRLLTFAYIHGFCRDESSSCYSSLTHISEIIGYTRRTVAEAINALIEDGYIYKIGTTTIDGQQVNGYRTYFYELMDRYEAGEEIKPSLISSRRGMKKGGSAQSSLVHIFPEGSEQNNAEVVNKFPKGSEQSSPNNNRIIKNNNLSDSAPAGAAPAREAEEREFIKIFFLNNAADPAAEMKRFVGYYQSKGWQDNAGRKYDTPEKRAGLAYGWDCKSGPRLTPGENTNKFYKFIGVLYKYATERGGINPGQLLDTRMEYKLEGDKFYWECSEPVQQWCESKVSDMLRGIIDTTMGQVKLFYIPFERK